jgi:D-hydroxyproline dehydrogenase subunit alpha
VNEFQETTVTDVFCAGEPTGVGGAECALVEGQIAGLAAAGLADRRANCSASAPRGIAFRDALNDTFSPPRTAPMADGDTIVCRCEDVRRETLEPFADARAAKLHTRCGMGACQGRICGAATRFLFGWESDSVRPPAFPVRVDALMTVEETTNNNTSISEPSA